MNTVGELLKAIDHLTDDEIAVITRDGPLTAGEIRDSLADHLPEDYVILDL